MAIPLVRAADLVGKIERAPGGINIVGGVVELDGARWLLKFVGGEEAKAQAMADAIKPLFSGLVGEPGISAQIGVEVRALADAYKDQLVTARGTGVRTADGRVLRNVSYGPGKPVLLLRFIEGLQAMRGAAVPLELRLRWMPVFVLRVLVMGARDPWSNIQWMPAGDRFVSFDEGTAFGAEMLPGSAARKTYLAKTPKVTAAFRAQLAAMLPAVAQLQARWRAEVSKDALRAALAAHAGCERVVSFVHDAIGTMPADWTALFGPPPMEMPAAVASPADEFVDPPRNERAYNQRTFMGGLTLATERSRMQKAARRGLVEDTRYAAAVMLGSQNFTNAVRRLATMAVEDVCAPAVILWVARPLGRLLLLREAACVQVRDGWRDLRNCGEVRELLAAAATYLAAAPASRMHDHIAGALFKDDHPFCCETSSIVPLSEASVETAPARMIELVDQLQHQFSLEGERELLYLLGGMWGVLQGAPHQCRGETLPPGHAKWFLHQLLARADNRMCAVLTPLLTLFEELNNANAQKGKLFAIAAAVFWARSSASVPVEHALLWDAPPVDLPPPALTTAEYRRLISGEWRIPVHDWVFDLHAGNHTDTKVAFYAREQAGLANCMPASDVWYDECLRLAGARLAVTGDRRGKRVCAASSDQ